MDAEFWLKVLETLDLRGISHDSDDEVREVVEELEASNVVTSGGDTKRK